MSTTAATSTKRRRRGNAGVRAVAKAQCGDPRHYGATVAGWGTYRHKAVR